MRYKQVDDLFAWERFYMKSERIRDKNFSFAGMRGDVLAAIAIVLLMNAAVSLLAGCIPVLAPKSPSPAAGMSI